MKVLEPKFEILTPISDGGIEELKRIERIARTCYKSEDKIQESGESAKKMIAGLIKSQHFAMLEHSSLSVMFTVDRGVSHELVRHRVASFAQESTRYCNYSDGKFGGDCNFISPETAIKYDPKMKNLPEDALTAIIDEWYKAMENAEMSYRKMIYFGATPQIARAVLPNSTKAEITVTANYREWRHIFELRAVGTTGNPHPQIKEIMIPLLIEVSKRIPVVFDDLVQMVEMDQ